MKKHILSWGTALLLAIGSIASINALAATTNVSVTTTTYTAIAGPGAVSATVTASRDIQYEFSATIPAPSIYGHRLRVGESIPLSSMGTGIYMWVRGEVEAATVVITSGTDATIGASGGGGSTSLLALESGGNLDFISSSVTGLNNAIGSATPGLAGNKSLLVGGVYNSSVPTLTNGQQASFQFDSASNLKVSSSALSTIATQTARFPYLSATQGDVAAVALAASNCTSGTAGCNLLDAGNVPWTDARGFGLIEVKVVATAALTAGAYTVETADDSSGKNPMTQTCYYFGQSLSGATATFPVTLTTAANYRLFCPLNNGYVRVRITTSITTSGGNTANFSLYASNQASPFSLVQQLTTPWSISGQAAHAASISGNPVRLGARALTSNYTAVTTGQTSDLISTLVGALIQKPYSIPEADWNYAAAASGISNTTTAVAIAAAAGSGLRNYITGIQLSSDALGAATELAVRDGASGTVIWRKKIGTAGIVNGINYTFPSPLKSTANTLLEVVTLTASITGSVYFNAQGYIAP